MEDFNLTPGKPVISDELSILKQEIDILFDTTPGDVHGNINFGTDYEYSLYNLQLSAQSLEDQMYEDLMKMDLLGWTPDVSVKLYQGTERDIALIQVSLSKNEDVFNKTYKIQ